MKNAILSVILVENGCFLHDSNEPWVNPCSEVSPQKFPANFMIFSTKNVQILAESEPNLR
jgi:hypothetical protein